MIPTREDCKRLWEANRDYIEENIEAIDIFELVMFERKQNALYLAWFQGDFSRLLLPAEGAA